MDEPAKLKKGPTQDRWKRAMQDKAFDLIRQMPILETRPEHFLRVFENGTIARAFFYDVCKTLPSICRGCRLEKLCFRPAMAPTCGSLRRQTGKTIFSVVGSGI
jgi:hypothetical protein